MDDSSELTSANQPMSAPVPPPLPPQGASIVPASGTAGPAAGRYNDDLVRCPSCGSSQFFGRRRITGIGWTLYMCALANILVSGLLMFVFIGFITIFLTPILALIARFGCCDHVNTCARCKKDF